MRAFFSFYTDALRIAVQSIFAHKLRAFLTLIGIIIGVASVVTVGASISGLNTYVVDKVAKVLGSNHFMIARMAFSGRMTDEEFEARNRRNKRLNWDDYEWVRDHCANCTEVGAGVQGQSDLKQEGIEFPGAMVFGVSANMVDIFDGGPTVTAQTDSIRTVRESDYETVAEIGEGGRTKTLLATGRLKDFRACFASTKRAAKKGLCIDAEAAELLEVKVGDQVLAVAR